MICFCYIHVKNCLYVGLYIQQNLKTAAEDTRCKCQTSSSI